MKPAVVIFDLFGTIVEWRAEDLPRLDVGGRSFPSTLPLLFPILREDLGNLFDSDSFLGAYRQVIEEITEERRRHATEVTCEARFVRTLECLGLDGSRDLARRLTRRHMRAVREVTHAPEARVEAVRRIARRYRVALLSNFDDSEAGRAIVSDTGLVPLFESIVISADHAVRKPHPEIFRHALAELDVLPGDALFVGDTPEEDILGAHRFGLRSVWLSERKSPYPEDLPRADYEVPDLTGLPDLLGIR